MQLNNLPKINTKGKKRVGRGIGSGKGKTSGRGQKGQKARGKIPASLIGGSLALYKKLPMLRGVARGRQRIPVKTIGVNLERLNFLKVETKVDLETLIKARIVTWRQARRFGVKILGKGEVSVPLVIKLPISKRALEKIERAGGKVG